MWCVNMSFVCCLCGKHAQCEIVCAGMPCMQFSVPYCVL